LRGCGVEAAAALLEKLHAGTARIAFSFGWGAIPDPNTGSIRVVNGSASGSLRFVEVAASCTHLVVPLMDSELAVVDLAGPGVELEPDPGHGCLGAL